MMSNPPFTPPAAVAVVPPRRTMFRRALARRCPICGGGPLFHRWLQMRPTCPRCGLSLNRGEDGYGLGAVWFNLLAAEAVSTFIWVTVAIRTWPDVPWDRLQWAGPLTAVLMPLLFYPFSKTLFLAFDLCFRPIDLTAGRPQPR
jgi:uncharacterized protein (DUF983 family)